MSEEREEKKKNREKDEEEEEKEEMNEITRDIKMKQADISCNATLARF